jgi:NCAIR mutase (PurE)-related protein
LPLESPAARLDLNRERRKGVPEVVFAEKKLPEHVIEIARSFLEQNGRVILSRVDAGLLQQLEATFTDPAGTMTLESYPAARMVVIRRPDTPRPQSGGRVGIISAGTADIPVAQEAQVLVQEMGCSVLTIYDVGVAGLHRLFGPLQQMLAASVDVIIVAAGMDGALPSVISGLVDVPVIGLPTSTGYGYGGQGVGALMSMLQTCAPGLAVVNIDNGIGAGAMAGMIANRVARVRKPEPTGTAPE